MILYLHIGLNKTGSSFIQSVFANNREYLIDKGGYFPSAGKIDSNMNKWEISPGNGLELCFSLRDNKKERVLRCLENYINKAESSFCKKVVVSNEGLFAALSSNRSLSLLVESCKSVGYEGVKALAYFRDPVSHLMSVYKHRSKTGRNKDFDQWISEGYETVQVMKDFLIVFDKSPVDWTFRKYKKDSASLLEATFSEWLGVQVPVCEENDKRVNPSLRLSEILLIQSVYEKNPYLTSFLYDSFLNLKPEQKADDTALETLYRYNAYNLLKEHMGVFASVNKLLPANEQLNLEVVEHPGNSYSASLSSAQIESITTALVDSQCVMNKARYLVRKTLIHLRN